MTLDPSSLPRSGRVRSGVCIPLEEAANELLTRSLKGVTSHEAKSDILTAWKERDRREREVLSHSGTVDPSIRRGMCRREANEVQTHLNSRDCVAPATRWTRVNDPLDFLDGPSTFLGFGES